MDEQIVLLDESLQPIGVAPKLATHTDKTPLHLAFSCFVFNQAGEFLLTQRAATKKVWPTVWTTSFCGHPQPGESLLAALARRGEYELGLTGLHNIEEILSDYRYVTPPYNGIIENEFCPVFFARTSEEPRPNPAEVDAYRWVNIRQLPAEINAHPDAYSYWLKDQLPLLREAFERIMLEDA